AQTSGPSLKERLEEYFEILPLEDGVALVPNDSLNGVRTIELRGERVAINGAPVTRAVLSSWLQEAAPPVLDLAALPPDRRAALFGFEAPDQGPPPAEGRVEEVEERVGGPDDANPGPPSPPPVEAPDAPPPLVIEHGRGPEIPEPPEPPSRHRGSRSGERVIFGHPLTVDRGEVVENAVVFGGPLEVDGEVLDAAVAFGGDVHIRGRVLGDVTSMGGSIYLEDGSEVQGDVVSVGGQVERSPGARVFGEISEAGFGWKGVQFNPGHWFDPDNWAGGPRTHWPVWGFFDLGGDFAKLFLLAALVALALFLARDYVQRVAAVIREEPWKAGLTGLGGCCLWFPAFLIVSVILAITIIGLPVVGLLLLATFVAALLGYAAVAYQVGSAVSRRFGWVLAPVVVGLVGLLLIRGWSLLGSIFHLGGWILFIPALALGIFGFLVNFSAWAVGFGGVLLTALQGRRNPPPPLPPLPVVPPSDAPLPPPADLPSEEELERVFEDSLEPEAPPEPATGDGPTELGDEPFAEDAATETPDEDGSSQDDGTRRS
ncbi:MAG: polymer-forming cytoskeletal protein, partial [Acidobacteria bacterium]|nr:polymer-forming cytoskeletal protein [Acidobacteriota bacterium]